MEIYEQTSTMQVTMIYSVGESFLKVMHYNIALLP